jgi:hypothetical protein
MSYTVHIWQIYRRNTSIDISQGVAKYLLHMPHSLTNIQTNNAHRYFIESCKIFTAYTTFTDGYTDGQHPLVFHKELQNIYCICHIHQHLYKQKKYVCMFKRMGTVHLPCQWSFWNTNEFTDELQIPYIIDKFN